MRSVISTLCLLLSASAMFAQSDRGTITGTVTDTSGAVIANAQIQAKQLDTAALFPTTSTDTGNYTLAQLPVGPYEITVTVAGFKKFVRSGISVQVAQTLRVDIPLEVGAASESVTVSAEGSLLKTESGDVSHNVDVSTLDTLPILGVGSAAAGSAGIRNPNNVLNVVPGVYYVANSQVKINGAQTNSYAYHVEGMDATNAGFPYAAAQTQPSVDAIQEVSIQTSNFAPEFGAVGGGFFNVTMRSGGNQYHGSAYDYIVNEVLNAGTPFTNAGATNSLRTGELIRPPARRHDYGFTVGGPASIPKLYNGKDRTFFFFNFEQFRETQITNNVPITVPTQAYRNGDFSGAIQAVATPANPNGIPLKDASGNVVGLANQIFDPTTGQPFPNNTIPASRIDPVAAKVQALIPLPNQSGAFQNYLPVYPAVRHTTIPALKIDQLLGSKQKISFYWSSTHTDAAFSPIYGGSEGLPAPITADRGSFVHSHVERLNYDYTLTPTMLLHVGVGYQQNNFFDDAPTLDYNAQTSLGLKGATVNRNFPVFNGFCPAGNACTAAGGTYSMGPGAGQSHQFWEKPGGNASLTWVRGSHTIKGGTDIYIQAVPFQQYATTAGAFTFSGNETMPSNLVNTTFTGGSLGFPYASFLLGAVDSYQIAAVADYRQSKSQLGFFLQDSWKVNRRLTIDYGVRYDYGTYFKEEHGRAVDFSPTTKNPAAGGALGAFIFEGSGTGHCNCDFAKNYPYAIGPRIGGAYSLNDKTVIRAGWGLIYGQTSTNSTGVNSAGIVNTAVGTSPGAGVPSMYLQNGIPTTPTWPVFSAGVAPFSPTGNQTLPAGVNFLDPSAGRPPRQNQWSIGIQREVMKGLAVEASYVANRGVWWQAPSLVDLNAVSLSTLTARGFNLSNPADVNVLFVGDPANKIPALLSAQLNSPTAAKYGFSAPPYPGFSTGQTVGQSLRPFPQFGNIPVSGAPLGKTWYDSLQGKLTKRYSHGLTLVSTFTWQKSLQVGTDGNTNLTYVNNALLGAQQAKSISIFDQPLLFTVAGSYQLPKIAMLKKAAYILQDWQVGTLLSYSSGLPIPVAAATTSINNQIFQPALYNRVPGVPLYLVSNLNCHCFDPSTTPVLNPAAWANPAAGSFASGAPFYSDYRYARHPSESINLGRTWRFKERVTLNLRAEFSNVFNRTFLNNPTSTNPSTAVSTSKTTGLLTGGFGYISTALSSTNQLAQPRNGTIVARFTF